MKKEFLTYSEIYYDTNLLELFERNYITRPDGVIVVLSIGMFEEWDIKICDWYKKTVRKLRELHLSYKVKIKVTKGKGEIFYSDMYQRAFEPNGLLRGVMEILDTMDNSRLLRENNRPEEIIIDVCEVYYLLENGEFNHLYLMIEEYIEKFIVCCSKIGFTALLSMIGRYDIKDRRIYLKISKDREKNAKEILKVIEERENFKICGIKYADKCDDDTFFEFSEQYLIRNEVTNNEEND